MRAAAFSLLVGLLLAPAGLARDPAPGFHRQSLRLPGMPAAVIPADMDGDGHEDLVVLVAYRKWEDVSEFEQSSFHGIEGLIEVMSVVTSLLDRRELRVYPGTGDGRGFGPQVAALDLPTSVHAPEAGHSDAPLVAVTDDGVAAVRLEAEDPQARLTLVPLLASVTSLSGSDTKRPLSAYRLYRLDRDLIAITLDFSLLPWVVRALTTRRLNLRMDFQDLSGDSR